MDEHTGDANLTRLLRETSWAARLARSLVGAELGEDLLQEAWAAALAHPPAEPVESSRAWLGTLLRRGASKMHRARGRRLERERRAAREEELPSTVGLRAREEERRVLVEAVLALPEAMREPLVLRYFDELTPKEIAARLGVPASTVRSRLQRGLEALREALERERGAEWRSWCLGLIPAAMLGRGVAAERTVLGGKGVLALLALLLVAAVGILGWSLGESGAPGEGGLTPRPDAEAEPATAALAEAPPDDVERQAIAADTELEAGTVTSQPESRVYVLRGLCLDEEKQPVADLRVVAANLRGTPSTVTDAAGVFTLPLAGPALATGPWQRASSGEPAEEVKLFVDGARHRAEATSVELGQQREVDVGVVQVVTAPRSVHGRALTAEGEAAEGALVYLLQDFDASLAPREIAHCSGFGRLTIPVGPFAFAETEPDGFFLLSGIPEGRFRLAIHTNGHDGLLTESLGADATERIELGNLRLERAGDAGSISGRVVTTTGEPIPEPWVMSRCGLADGRSRVDGFLIVGDADGRFRVPVPVGSTCALRVETELGWALTGGLAAGTHDLSIEVRPDSAAEPPERTEPVSTPRVAGRITLEGRGVGKARVVAWTARASGEALPTPGRLAAEEGEALAVPVVVVGSGRFARTESGADGHFAVAVPSGTPFVVLADFGPWDRPQLAELGPLELHQDEVREGLELVLRPAGWIAGVVLGDGAEALVGNAVLARSDGVPARKARIDADGGFRFDSLHPGRRYRLELAEGLSWAARVEPVVADVASGETTSVRLVLEGGRPASLRGRIRLDGEPPAGKWFLSLARDRGFITREDFDQRGEVHFEPLEPGRYTLDLVQQASPLVTFHRELDVFAGENTLELDLPTGRLELHDLPLPEELDLDFVAGGHYPVCLTWEGSDGLVWSCYPLEAKRGTAVVPAAPVGTVQLHLQDGTSITPPGEAPVVAELVVRAGETTEFTLPPR